MKNNMVKIIHVFKENIFIDYIIEQFKDMNIPTRFFCLDTGSSFLQKMKYKDEIEFFKNFKQLKKEVQLNDAIYVLHSRFIPFYKLNSLFKNKEIIWFLWGYDLYKDNRLCLSHNLINLKLYKPFTLGYLKSTRTIKQKIRNILSYFINFFSAKIFYSKLNYISCVLSNEFELIQNTKYKIHNFIPLRYINKQRIEISNFTLKKENTILINNSATPTGNHLDILRLISQHINTDTVIYIPFSYGVDKLYFEMVKNEVKRIGLEKNVIFLTNFIDYTEYRKILDSCNIAIFGHIRQQAIGNVVDLFSLGAKIFFYEDSISYRFYKSKGFHIYSLESNFSEHELTTLLDENLRKDNIDKLDKLNNYDTYLSELKIALKTHFDIK